MPKMKYLFLLCYVIGCVASKECLLNDGESILYPNHDYLYEFKSFATAEAVGTTDDSNTISVQCKARITHLEGCKYVLGLENCMASVFGGPSDTERQWNEQLDVEGLTKYNVVFVLTNGEIHEIFTHADDPIHWINIKRGMLSAFVFKLSATRSKLNQMQTDVHGTCPVTSLPTRYGARMSKDMQHCIFPTRQDWNYSPWSLFWNMSWIQNLINSTTDCESKVEDNILQKLDCQERHAIMLESSHKTTVAVQSNIRYTMTLKELQEPGVKPDVSEITRQRSIQFEYEITTEPDSNADPFPVHQMLSDLVHGSMDGVKLYSILQFTDFVEGLRNAADLTPLVKSVKECSFTENCSPHVKNLAMSYLSDALVQCNSVACVNALSLLAISSDLSPTYLNFVYYSWSNMPHSKTEILLPILNICKATDSGLCWTSLGALMKKISSVQKTMKFEDSKAMEVVLSDIHNKILGLCSSGSSSADNYKNLFKYLEAVKNSGAVYYDLLPDAIQQLTSCVLKSVIPDSQRLSILEVLYNLKTCENRKDFRKIDDRIRLLLLDKSLRTSLRYLAFKVLLNADNFAQTVTELLKKDDNAELKALMSTTLIGVLSSKNVDQCNHRFVDSLKLLLKEKEITLESFTNKAGIKSQSENGMFFGNLTFLPEEIAEIGYQMTSEKAYESYESLPRYFQREFSAKVFSRLFQIFKISEYSQGLEELMLVIQTVFKDPNNTSSAVDKVSEFLRECYKIFSGNNSVNWSTFNFDENVLHNIKKIVKKYQTFNPNFVPSFQTFLQLFGSTAFSFSNYDISNVANFISQMQPFIDQLTKGITMDNTRIIRVIEAYHQVPTMMGLPLNWTTNATLGISAKGKFKFDFQKELSKLDAEGHLKPSFALTFQNRLLVDLPTVTQIGVQANSSASSSTEFRADLVYTKDKKLLRFFPPNQTQDILHLVRTNQLIRHGRYEDIPDWDIERISSNWCSDEHVNSAVGLQLCRSKTYPNVTNRLKPWALMAGFCEWRLQLMPFDKKMQSYNLEILKVPVTSKRDVLLRLSKFGSDEPREIVISGNAEEKETKYEITMPSKPDFSILFSRNPIVSANKQSSCTMLLKLKFYEGFEYNLMYDDKLSKTGTQDKELVQNRPGESTHLNDHIRDLHLFTPFNSYRIKEETSKRSGNENKNIVITYENLHSSGQWLKDILPPAMWESDTKSRLNLRLHKKITTNGIHAVGLLQVPEILLQMQSQSLMSSGRQQWHINVTAHDLQRKELLTFANVTYNLWHSMSSPINAKEIRQLNVTIPRRSWYGQLNRIQNDGTILCESILVRSRMVPKDEKYNNYVGWWSADSSEKFDLHEQQMVFLLNTTGKLIPDGVSAKDNEQVLKSKLSHFEQDDISDLKSLLVTAEMSLEYPLSTGYESIDFDGFYIISEKKNTFRFQKDFNLSSSYHKFQLTSHTLYRNDSEDLTFKHQSYFTNIISQAKAYNTVKFLKSNSKNQCEKINFLHNIQSHYFNSESTVTYDCNSNGQDLHTLQLNWITNSSKWDMLNMQLNQIIKEVSNEFAYEQVNVSHPYGTLNVTADWVGPSEAHKKRVTLKCLNTACKEIILSLDIPHNGSVYGKLELPKEDDYQTIVYERVLSNDNKTLNAKLLYKKTNDSVPEGIEMSGSIVDEFHQKWTVNTNLRATSHIITLVMNGASFIKDHVVDIVNNPHHPFNIMVNPVLKTTISEYWLSSKAQGTEIMSKILADLQDIALSIKPFVDLPIEISKNVAYTTLSSIQKLFSYYKEKSVLIWSVEYFDVMQYLRNGWKQVPSIWKKWFSDKLNQNENVEFKLKTGKFLQLESFDQWPSFTSHSPNDDYKIGMIFGPHHVVTFDKHVYSIPEYTSSCTYLLAADAKTNSFAVLADPKLLYVLFPDITIAINEKDEVYVNGSQIPTKLPLQTFNGKVTVSRKAFIEVISPTLKIKCRGQDFMCIFELNKWHAMRTVGLLGNSDGSTYNDFMLPDGRIVSNLLSFLESYELTQNCQSQRLTPGLPSTNCSDYFKNTCKSSMQNTFMEACESDFCYSASAYSALCYERGFPSTVLCQDERRIDTPISHRLEVVLIVNQHIDLTVQDKKTAPYKGIERLLKAIDDKFTSQGYSLIQYAVLGFGGKGVRYRPSLYTKDRSLWNDLRTTVSDLLPTLEFKGTERNDVLSPLKYAAELLSYDSKNSKIFVVITPHDSQDKNKDSIEEIQSLLTKNGVTLYAFSSYPTIEKGKRVFGVRADGLVFPSPKKDAETYLDYPTGDIAKIVAGTHGSIFQCKFVMINNPNSFFSEVAEEVYAKVGKEVNKCRKCNYVSGKWWWSMNQCEIISC